MAVTDAYATAVQYRGIISKSDIADDAAILVDLTAISRYMEGRLGRFFTQDAAAVSRLYVPSESTTVLRVDDLSAAPSSVKIDDDDDGVFTDETALAAADYELCPLNADKGPEVYPWDSIRLTPWGSRSYFPAGVRVQVTAKFGWPAVPSAIQRACIHLTAILRLESPRATRRIQELDQVIETSPDAQRIIRQLTQQYQVHYFS